MGGGGDARGGLYGTVQMVLELIEAGHGPVIARPT